MTDRSPAWYLVFGADGAATSSGFTPDGTLPDGAAVCTEDMAARPWSWTLIDGQVAAAPLPASALIAHANTTTQAMLAAPLSYSAASVTIHSDATASTLTDWMALQQWAQTVPAGVTQWVANDNSVCPLPAAAVPGIALQIGAYAQTLYQALAAALTGVADGTIITQAQIDAAFQAVARAP